MVSDVGLCYMPVELGSRAISQNKPMQNKNKIRVWQWIKSFRNERVRGGNGFWH